MHVVRKMASLLLIGAIACALLTACGGSTNANSGQAPTASFSCAVSATNSLSATCTAVASDPDGSAPTYAWNFGDGVVDPDTVAKSTHTYIAAGTYTVTLTVTGEGNSVSRIQTVTVTGGTAGLINWAWIGGSNYANSFGTYETVGGPSPANAPSARQSAVSWTDKQGRLWLFGGNGYDSTGFGGLLNDLWRFAPTFDATTGITSGQWTWVSGSNRANSAGGYGTQGTTSSSTMPGARANASRWIDASGNFWLFGGSGYDSVGVGGSLNDMWEINPQTGAATWITGSANANAAGSYVQQGVASAANTPGERSYATTWTDNNGMLWLFGGESVSTAGISAALDDLWKFDPVAKQWTWVSGSSTAVNVAGIYGTQGVGSTGNLPGARFSAQSWTDSSGNLWLFGGTGYDSAGTGGVLNDMWSYSPTAGTWTWISGSKVAGAAGAYGTQGTPAAGNTPSARVGSVGWTDASGMLWLFGGGGSGTAGIVTTSVGQLNDLWNFNPATQQWTWMGGQATVDGLGIYATEGTASNLSIAGARMWSTSWVDANGNPWLFGGAGVDVQLTLGDLNDLWNIQIVAPKP